MAKSTKRSSKASSGSAKGISQAMRRAQQQRARLDLVAAELSRAEPVVSRVQTTNGMRSVSNREQNTPDGFEAARLRQVTKENSSKSLPNTGRLSPAPLRAAESDTRATTNGLSSLAKRSTRTPEKTDKPIQKAPTCKKRPDSRDARKGSGGSRAFIPWCK